MKIVLLFSIIPILSIGQITITDADMPSANKNYYYSNVLDFLFVDVNQTGTNFNWDFSNLTYQDQDSVITKSVSSTPFAYQFYFNNIFLYPDHYASFAQQGEDISAFNMINVTDRFDYFKTSNSDFSAVGFGANINGIPSSVKYDTIDQILPLPLTYGMTDSTSASYLASIPTFGSYGQWIRRKVEVDGWGSLTTPFSSYDALRVKTTLYQEDTIYVDQLMIGYTTDRPVKTMYEWYANNKGVPIVSIIAQSGIIVEMKFLDQLHVSKSEFITDRLNIYPNPVIDILQVEMYNNENYIIEIYNSKGCKIDFWKSDEIISLVHLDQGIYFIKAISNRHTFVKKIIKV